MDNIKKATVEKKDFALATYESCFAGLATKTKFSPLQEHMARAAGYDNAQAHYYECKDALSGANGNERLPVPPATDDKIFLQTGPEARSRGGFIFKDGTTFGPSDVDNLLEQTDGSHRDARDIIQSVFPDAECYVAVRSNDTGAQYHTLIIGFPVDSVERFSVTNSDSDIEVSMNSDSTCEAKLEHARNTSFFSHATQCVYGLITETSSGQDKQNDQVSRKPILPAIGL